MRPVSTQGAGHEPKRLWGATDGQMGGTTSTPEPQGSTTANWSLPRPTTNSVNSAPASGEGHHVTSRHVSSRVCGRLQWNGRQRGGTLEGPDWRASSGTDRTWPSARGRHGRQKCLRGALSWGRCFPLRAPAGRSPPTGAARPSQDDFRRSPPASLGTCTSGGRARARGPDTPHRPGITESSAAQVRSSHASCGVSGCSGRLAPPFPPSPARPESPATPASQPPRFGPPVITTGNTVGLAPAHLRPRATQCWTRQGSLVRKQPRKLRGRARTQPAAARIWPLRPPRPQHPHVRRRFATPSRGGVTHGNPTTDLGSHGL